MGTFLIMLRSVLLFVALAIPGYVLVRAGIMKAESSGAGIRLGDFKISQNRDDNLFYPAKIMKFVENVSNFGMNIRFANL